MYRLLFTGTLYDHERYARSLSDIMASARPRPSAGLLQRLWRVRRRTPVAAALDDGRQILYGT
jgi:hypothetical protein